MSVFSLSLWERGRGEGLHEQVAEIFKQAGLKSKFWHV